MYIKVFAHGQGGGDGPVNYLLRLDYPGRTQSPPEVLRGDPNGFLFQSVTIVTNSLPHILF